MFLSLIIDFMLFCPREIEHNDRTEDHQDADDLGRVRRLMEYEDTESAGNERIHRGVDRGGPGLDPADTPCIEKERENRCEQTLAEAEPYQGRAMPHQAECLRHMPEGHRADGRKEECIGRHRQRVILF